LKSISAVATSNVIVCHVRNVMTMRILPIRGLALVKFC
jgi:hypothetical protein